MNVHLPRSFLSTTEMAYVFPSSRGIVTAQRNGPVNACEHDALVGAWLLTMDNDPNYYVSWSLAYDCIVYAELSDKVTEWLERCYPYYSDFITESNGEYSYNRKVEGIPGKMLLSILFPSNFNYTKRSDKVPEHPFIKIQNGVILSDSAPIDKETIGAKRNNIIHLLWIEYGEHVCQDFISNIQFIINRYLFTRGLSIGISDCITEAGSSINRLLTDVSAKCVEILSEPLGEEREDKINRELNSAMPSGMSLAAKSMNKGRYNSLNIMRDCGAKGSSINCGQIVAFLGQQSIEGKRAIKTLSGRSRRLPYFEENEDTPEAGGFIYNSYTSGLTPSEFFFHAQAGRVGVIDTSIRTAESGYAYKRISKKMEDFIAKADGSVRDAGGCIIQFQYGDDGYNPINLINCPGVRFPIPFDLKREMDRINGSSNTTYPKGRERSLTDSEITLLLSRVRIGDHICELTEYNNQIFQSSLRKILENKDLKIYPNLIPNFCRRLFDRHAKSRVDYGEAVGLIAASAIGEPTTQSSVVGDTWVYVKINDEIRYVKIGSLIDTMMERHKNYVLQLDHEHIGSELLVKEDFRRIEVLSVDPRKETVSWKRVCELSRHPVNGRLVEVTTHYGRKIITTLSHSHLQFTSLFGILPIKGNDLSVGGCIPTIADIEHFIPKSLVTTRYINIGSLRRGDVIIDRIKELKMIDPPATTKVYDFGVEGHHNFMVANGIFTHNTLSQFHMSGVAFKDVTLGLPRLEELLNATKNPSKIAISIFFNNTLSKEDLYLKRKIFEGVTMQSLVERHEIIEVGKEIKPPEWRELAVLLLPSPKIKPKDWIIRLHLSLDRLFEYNLTLVDVQKAIENEIDIDNLCVIRSPLNIGQIEIYTDIDSLISYADSKKYDMSVVDNLPFYLSRDVILKAIEKIIICGIEGITKTMLREEDGKDCPFSSTNEKEWVIDASSSYSGNLVDILIKDDVDISRTWSNDLWETLSTFGIEATRTILFNELSKVLGFDGTYINPRHVQLLTDSMTRNGKITSVRRDGITEDAGVLAQGLFEKSIDNFSTASMFGKVDKLTGISGSVMFGTNIPMGTGSVVVRSKDEAVI